MSFSLPPPTPASFTHLVHSFTAEEVLSESHVQKVCDDLKIEFAGEEERVWGVVLTLLTFLHQVVSGQAAKS